MTERAGGNGHEKQIAAKCQHTVRGTRVQCQLELGHEGDHVAPFAALLERPDQAGGISEAILRREYQAEIGRLREAYERVRRERDEARAHIGCTCSQGRSWDEFCPVHGGVS